MILELRQFRVVLLVSIASPRPTKSSRASTACCWLGLCIFSQFHWSLLYSLHSLRGYIILYVGDVVIGVFFSWRY